MWQEKTKHGTREGTGSLTCIVVLDAHLESPGERGAQVELGVGAVQEGRAGRSDVRGQHGIVKSRTGVVGINVEVVVVVVGSARGLQVEGLGGVAGLAGVQHRASSHSRRQQGKRGKELHYGWYGREVDEEVGN